MRTPQTASFCLRKTLALLDLHVFLLRFANRSSSRFHRPKPSICFSSGSPLSQTIGPCYLHTPHFPRVSRTARRFDVALTVGLRGSSLQDTFALEMAKSSSLIQSRRFRRRGGPLRKRKTPFTFEQALLKAESYVGRKEKLLRLIEIASSKSERYYESLLAPWENLQIFFRMVRAHGWLVNTARQPTRSLRWLPPSSIF